MDIGKAIALEMDIGTSFRKRRVIKRKRHFDENPDDKNVATQSAEESFRNGYFTTIVDKQLCHLQADLNNMRLAERFLFLIYFQIIAVIG